MNENDELYQKAVDVISELFSDSTVSRDKTIENLEGLKGEIDVMLESLEE